ncbi:hypothetical protein ACRXID_06160 [Ligilactobacillus animalis]|uniref:Uncharacterized protein n=1 Tax=Ligilactobacillus animalis TaxID=1605 RepID=A0ABR4RN57_9LACO|nr:hypothetical protein [Ligilactobacillus animalis]KDA45533.1 hypothetical protein Lani381_1381 [Ligilactobacillus animalis]MEE0260794.1 hypothetical protein [Ligilactobacillus animalis]PNQ51937.1 hypothetical protein C0L91_08455 [Ligilactobacillus animalis]
MGIVGEFLLHRWYVFVIAILYWLVMKYLGKGTRFAREASQVSATLQILFLLVYTGAALWLLASGTAASQAFTLFTLVVNIGGVVLVLPLFLLILYRLCTAKFLTRLPEWGKNLFRLICFALLGFFSYPILAVVVTLYYGW